MLNEKEAHPEKVTMMIQTLLIDEDRLAQMSKASFQLGKPNATKHIVDEAIELIK